MKEDFDMLCVLAVDLHLKRKWEKITKLGEERCEHLNSKSKNAPSKYLEKAIKSEAQLQKLVTDENKDLEECFQRVKSWYCLNYEDVYNSQNLYYPRNTETSKVLYQFFREVLMKMDIPQFMLTSTIKNEVRQDTIRKEIEFGRKLSDADKLVKCLKFIKQDLLFSNKKVPYLNQYVATLKLINN